MQVDVSTMEIGDIVYVSDLNLAEEIEVLDEPQRIVAAVSQPRVQIEATPDEEAEGEGEGEGEEEGAADAPSEPEVISKRRDDS